MNSSTDVLAIHVPKPAPVVATVASTSAAVASKLCLGLAITAHSARITGPVPYRAASGRVGNIPLGPCLVERLDTRMVDIIWGARGQSSAALPVEDIEAAQENGNLIMLD